MRKAARCEASHGQVVREPFRREALGARAKPNMGRPGQDSMKEVVPCAGCVLCGVHTPIGFTSVPELWCSRTNEYVDPDDGCTMGVAGEPNQAVVPLDTYLTHEPVDW